MIAERTIGLDQMDAVRSLDWRVAVDWNRDGYLGSP